MAKNKNNRFTQQELDEMLKSNPGLKIASQTPIKDLSTKAIPTKAVAKGGKKATKKSQSINASKAKDVKPAVSNYDLSQEEIDFLQPALKTKKTVKSTKSITSDNSDKKSLGIDVKKSIIDENKKCLIELSYSKDHFSMSFTNARLLSVNQLFSILQYRKYEVFRYKKMWQDLIINELKKYNDLPFYSQECEIILYRQCSKKVKKVDSDALATMFKFIIDALKTQKPSGSEESFQGVLSDDNPDVVHSIKLVQERGNENIVAIRLQRAPKLPVLELDKIKNSTSRL